MTSGILERKERVEHPRMLIAPIAALVFAAAAALGQPLPSNSDLPYAVIGGRALRLDLYQPPSAIERPVPLVIWIHGGGWNSGSRRPLPDWCAPLPEAGIAVAAIDYRLLGQSALFGGESVIFPAQVHDIKGAIRWLRAHATGYGLDPQRIALWGSSAGAHLAAIAAASGDEPAIEGSVGGHSEQSSAVRALVAYAPPTDLVHLALDVAVPPGIIWNPDAHDAGTAQLIGFDQPGQGMAVLRENLLNPDPPFPAFVTLAHWANPVTWVGAGHGAVFLAHGSGDDIVPLGQSRRLRDALLVHGATVAYRELSGVGHAGFAFDAATHAAARQFLTERLLDAIFGAGFE